MPRGVRRLAPWLAGAMLLAGPAARVAAQQMAAPVEVQFSLFYRIIAYDRALAQRNPDTVVVGVLYQPEVRASVLARDEALRQAAPSSAGFVSRLVPIALSDSTDVGEVARRAGCDLLYVTPLRAVNIRRIGDAAAEQGILTLTGVPDYVERGIAVGVGLRGERPEILVNLAAARRQGADFSAQLLRLAKVL